MCEIIAPFGEDLRLERVFNVPMSEFSSLHDRVDFMRGFMNAVNDEKLLADARHAAKKSWPIELHSDRGIKLVVEADDLSCYAPQLNAHGDPSRSMKNFLSEIVRAKSTSNNLSKFRPNLIMANCLSTDLQMGYDYPIKPDLSDLEMGSIDALLVCSCGIDSSPIEQPWLLHTKLESHPIRSLYVGRTWVSTLT